MVAVEIVSDVACRVGESPVWDAGRNCLWWCDCPAGIIRALDMASGQLEEHRFAEPVGSFGLAGPDGLVVALASGVGLYRISTRRLTMLVDPEPGHAAAHPGDRLNDGKVGPDGAFWIGSIHKGGPTAALFRVTADGRAECKVTGLSTSNGLAFSADGRVLFHSDSGQRWIERHDLDPLTGALSNRRRIAMPGEAEGRPDGAATDMAGHYWSAGVSAGCLNRFTPDGVLERRIILPVKRPTMVCFGGPDMRTVFVTSIRRPEDASEHCGKVLALRVDVAGVPVGSFAAEPPSGGRHADGKG